MIKGISGYGYLDVLKIPIIENTSWEHELADSLGEAISKNPKTIAVLVRNHGIYVWGNTWEEAKRHSECLHYLFELTIELHKLQLTAVQSLKFSNHYSGRSYIFDIEGTITPITFVKDVLFPFAYENAQNFLERTWDDQEIKSLVVLLIEQSIEDCRNNIPSPIIDPEVRDKTELIKILVKNIQWNIDRDRKLKSLKTLQGHIWKEAYADGRIKSIIYDDAASFFPLVHKYGARISIYSSGSQSAQNLLVKYSNHGDLSGYIHSYFDTNIGQKRESKSYQSICLTLGIENKKNVLFVTDIYEEAFAANEAGLEVALISRPGNASLPTHSFKLIHSFDELLSL